MLQVFNRQGNELLSGNKRFTQLSVGKHVVLESDSSDASGIVAIPESHTIICTDFITIYLILAVTITIIIVPIIISTVALIIAFKTKGIQRKNIMFYSDLQYCSVFQIVSKFPLLLMSGLLCHMDVAGCGPRHNHVSVSVTNSLIQMIFTTFFSIIIVLSLVLIAEIESLLLPLSLISGVLLLTLILNIISLVQFSQKKRKFKTVFKTSDPSQTDSYLTRFI